MPNIFRFAMLSMALSLGVVAGSALAKSSSPPNWPTNPYWVHTPPPKGPGHKVKNFNELLEKSGDAKNIGIKVGGLKDWNTGEIGTYEVGDVMTFFACIGTKNARWALNHKSGNGGGVDKAKLSWMDESGQKVLREQIVDGGCG